MAFNDNQGFPVQELESSGVIVIALSGIGELLAQSTVLSHNAIVIISCRMPLCISTLSLLSSSDRLQRDLRYKGLDTDTVLSSFHVSSTGNGYLYPPKSLLAIDASSSSTNSTLLPIFADPKLNLCTALVALHLELEPAFHKLPPSSAPPACLTSVTRATSPPVLAGVLGAVSLQRWLT